MTKELSIENIKKELIDKISNNSEILEYFENYLHGEEFHKHCLKEYGMNYIKDNYIYPYDMSMSGYSNFIAVDVNEVEDTYTGGITMYYKVNIIIALEKYKDLDKISVLLGKIVSELYPDRFGYKNTAYIIEYSHNQFNDKRLARVVQFTIS